MTEIEFFPYHNRHIVFKLKNGDELSGVLIDSGIKRDSKKPRTVYTFIPTSNLRAWKKAEKEKDQDLMNSLQDEVDIANIIWAQRVNYKS